jgi:hypothetical protein
VAVALDGGASALVLPATALIKRTPFRRDVVAHLILDRSAHAETNGAAVIARARSALEALPQHVRKVRITWANYEQEDVPGEPLSRAEAALALDRSPSLPFRGGFCAGRVIQRVLLAENTSPRNPRQPGMAPLFVAIPAPGSDLVKTESGAPFARLAPDLPFYAVFENGFRRFPLDPAATNGNFPSDFIPENLVMVKHGETPYLMTADRDCLLLANDSPAAEWEIVNPDSGTSEKLENLAVCSDPEYRRGLSLWSRHRDVAFKPAELDAALPGLVGEARSAGVLIPEAAFIVLETQSQDVMLARKEKQSLSANNALEFDEFPTKQAPAPPAAWLALPGLWFLWRRRRFRATAADSSMR